MALHLVLLILLALIYFPQAISSQLVIVATATLDRGDQLKDRRVTIPTFENVEQADSTFSSGSMQADASLAAVPPLQIKVPALETAVQANTSSIGMALSGRIASEKRALLATYGGTAETERSVDLGLKWLRRNQRRDGQWSLTGPYKNGSGSENPTAATAMAALAFLGSGHTHKVGQHRQAVARGMRALVMRQDRDGNFFLAGPENHRLYSQALATIAVCELYGMTQDQQFREPAQRALDYAARIQADGKEGAGGWRYSPGQDIDTSVTGWFVMALQSGRMAGLSVSEESLPKVDRFLDQVTNDGVQYSYVPVQHGPSIAMTAEALLCRQYRGWQKDDPRLIAGAALLNENPLSWDKKNVYYWYYASQVLHHLGGNAWWDWNQEMRVELPRHQETTGRERGSWHPRGDPYGASAGRLYVTCLCLYSLEVYYRHLPLYR
jgi:hypothetical protein